LDTRNITPQKGLSGNPNGKSRPLFNEIIDSLSKIDLGPTGFFVICHSARGE
jgi:hypothetical protein